jgi:hypothetical protein
MSIPERKSDRCVDLSHPDRHSDFWLFTVRFIVSFVGFDIYFGQRIIGC